MGDGKTEKKILVDFFETLPDATKKSHILK